MGSLVSGNHAFYHPRNLPSDSKVKLHFPFCEELKNNVSLTTSSASFPKLALFKINTNFTSNFWNSFAGPNYRKLQGITFIDDLVIKKVEKNTLADLMQGAFMAFIAPHDFAEDTAKKDGTRNYYYDQIEDKFVFQETDGQQ